MVLAHEVTPETPVIAHVATPWGREPLPVRVAVKLIVDPIGAVVWLRTTVTVGSVVETVVIEPETAPVAK